MPDSEDLKELYTDSFHLKDLVSYQKGTVISRTLVDRDSGTLTVFALDEGESISEHTAPFDALVEILDGKAKIVISGEEIVLNAGESTVMPANEPHALEAVENFKMLLVMIK